MTKQSQDEWMQTYTGRAFWPLDPSPAAIDPTDIAHALSMLCRYGGHAHRFYSVAEHCVLMSHAVSPENALWALLHDAAEAYLGDMVRPLKRAMPAYREAEDRLMTAICQRFDLATACPDEVRVADTRILRDERAVVMSEPPMPWSDAEQVKPLGVTVHCWLPRPAEIHWIERFNELRGAQ